MKTKLENNLSGVLKCRHQLKCRKGERAWFGKGVSKTRLSNSHIYHKLTHWYINLGSSGYSILRFFFQQNHLYSPLKNNLIRCKAHTLGIVIVFRTKSIVFPCNLSKEFICLSHDNTSSVMWLRTVVILAPLRCH